MPTFRRHGTCPMVKITEKMLRLPRKMLVAHRVIVVPTCIRYVANDFSDTLGRREKEKVLGYFLDQPGAS